jgi:hypothetical protein
MINPSIRQDSRGNTQFVLKLPYSLRTRLHAASQSTGASQQSIVRASIATYLDTLHPTPERPALIPPAESPSQTAPEVVTEESSTQAVPEMIDQVVQQPKRRKRSR